MSQKIYGKNLYWGDGLAPVNCQYRISVKHFSRSQFRIFMHECKRDGIYYNHDTENKVIVLAFETELQRNLHALVLEANAKAAGVAKNIKK